MQTWTALITDLQRHWPVYLSMPFVAALVGYVTKVVAIRMMFEPVEFIGIKPWFGWQGIVPRKAGTMAAVACDTLTSKLIKPQEIFARLDPARVADEIRGPLLEAMEEVTNEVARQQAPQLWEALLEPAKRLLIQRIQDQAPTVIQQVMQEMQSKIDRVFDLKEMMVTALSRDKKLLNRIFQEAGKGEFRFIRNSGIPFGFAIGCVQALTWALTHNVWVMPLFGAFTGWFTDWLALKMVFAPREPKRYLGIFEWQGLFLKRRKEVAAEYGALIAREILTARNLIEALLRGPLSDRLYELIQKHIDQLIDEQAGVMKPMAVFAIGSERYREMKRRAAERVIARLPDTLSHVEKYADDAMDIRNTLVTKMQEMTPEEFEGVLRPVFQQDERTLILVGAVLGFLVGEFQVFMMTH